MQKQGLILCLAAGFSAAAMAQSTLSGTSISGSGKASEPMLTAPVGASAAAYKTESGIYLYPTAFAGIGYNDNLQTSNTNVVGSGFVNFAPKLVAEMKHKGNRYTALASVDAVRYEGSAADNYTHSELELAGDHYFTARARAAWAIGQLNSTDERGANNRPISTSPDRWHSTNVNGRFIYGAPEASGRLELDLGQQDKSYNNNRATTAVADVTVNSIAGRVFYRLGTRTLALAEVRQAQADYASALATDSNTERRYYAGLTWEATAATTGIVKVGRMTKDFERAGKSGFTGNSWEATVRWLPRTYSAFELQTARSTADATGFGDYSLNTSVDLRWKHNWSQSLSSSVSVGTLSSDFGGTTRSDTAKNYALAVDYSVLRWLKIGVDIAGTDNSSNIPSAAYKRNVAMVTLNASL